MTTRVTIEPAGHRIEVTLSKGEGYDEQRQILEIGAPPATFWIFGRRELHAKEIPPESSATP